MSVAAKNNRKRDSQSMHLHGKAVRETGRRQEDDEMRTHGERTGRRGGGGGGEEKEGVAGARVLPFKVVWSLRGSERQTSSVTCPDGE
jgi:hypothetical protein